MDQRFRDKVILITGGNSGMGLVTARKIVAEGGRVVVTGRDAASLDAAQKELGANARAVRSDSGSLKDIEALFALVKREYGRLDGLFANAGVHKFTPIDQVTEGDFDWMFDVNVKGVFFTLQKAVPLLVSGSSVVINASVAGSKGGALSSVYGATKAAARSLARTFSGAYALQGIRFNAVSPGPIETPIWDRPEEGLPTERMDVIKKGIADANPLKRYGTADEVAAAVLFLLSSESSYIVGSELFVDGGANQL